MTTSSYTIDDLLYLMDRLRDPDTGCPWDIQQRFDTITSFTLEETYEVIDAIERKDFAHLGEELGDLLFQVVFYSRLGKEQGYFDFQQVVSTVVDKLISRHPHVFPDGHLSSEIDPSRNVAQDPSTVKSRWESIKAKERQNKGETQLFDDVPQALPALSRAAKLQKRASHIGFDWPDYRGPLAKIIEEYDELSEAIQGEDKSQIQQEAGDLLFSVVNLCRHLKVDAETALRQSSNKFCQRMLLVEEQAKQEGVSLSQCSDEDLDRLWEQAKQQR